MSYPIVTEIKLLQKQRTLQINFANGDNYLFSCEFLRRHSPSAEMKEYNQLKSNDLQIDSQVNIIKIEPVGNYAVKLYFDDGHQSGLFSWQYLQELGKQMSKSD